MTRFARSKGSKASNERVEEDATSWAEMKHQLESKKEEIQTQAKQMEAQTKRQANYDKFLKENELDESKKSTWADFPQTITQIKLKNKHTKQKYAAPVSKAVEFNIKVQSTNAQVDNAELVKDTKQIKQKAKKRKPTSENKSEKPKKVQKKDAVNITPKKKIEEMTETELKKFEKNKYKKLKQLEKRKLKKQKLKEEKAAKDSMKQEIDEKDQVTKPINFAKSNKVSKNIAPKVKKFDKEYKRRKPLEAETQKVTINGKEIELVKFDGFPVKKEDADRLHTLRKQMISKGLPRSEVRTALKLERRRAEKALARDKKNVCYNCRMAGHVLAECPNIGAGADNVDTAASGICFKCGSTEHTHFQCKVVKNQEFRFASCFICKEQGHISWQCPDNARGLYPKGGGCKLCGDVTHLKKDCPKHVAEQKANEVSLDMLTESGNPDTMDQNNSQSKTKVNSKPNKIIKF